MAVLDDLMNAIDNYATTGVKTEIVNFSILPGGGSVLNVGDTFQFKVRVKNEGHLDMKNVKAEANGTQFADVGLSNAPPFSGSAVSNPFTLNALQEHTTGFFKGKCKAHTSGTAKDIVTARVSSWDASLDHILADHSDAGAAEGKLNKSIAPS